MKVLVTGGAGFIGSHLIKELQKHSAEIVILDNFSTGSKKNLPPQVEIFEADICDESAVAKVLAAGKFEAIVHLAGQTTVAESIKNPQLDAQINILGTINLLEAARRYPVKKIIFASTAAVYGNSAELPIKENQPTKPMSFYALSKLSAENYFKLYQKFFGVNYVILRFANVYGERQSSQNEGGVISIFAQQVSAGEKLKIFGDGEQTRDFIHAADIARAIFQALTTQNDNEIFNVSTQTSTTLNELVAAFEKVSGRKILVEYEPAREGEIRHSQLSNVRAFEKLKWQPKISLSEGLTRTLRYLEGEK